MLTVSEASRLVDVSAQAIYSWIHNGHIRKVMRGGAMTVYKHEVTAYANRRKNDQVILAAERRDMLTGYSDDVPTAAAGGLVGQSVRKDVISMTGEVNRQKIEQERAAEQDRADREKEFRLSQERINNAPTVRQGYSSPAASSSESTANPLNYFSEARKKIDAHKERIVRREQEIEETLIVLAAEQESLNDEKEQIKATEVQLATFFDMHKYISQLP